jgi:hypothetical protein
VRRKEVRKVRKRIEILKRGLVGIESLVKDRRFDLKDFEGRETHLVAHLKVFFTCGHVT